MDVDIKIPKILLMWNSANPWDTEAVSYALDNELAKLRFRHEAFGLLDYPFRQGCHFARIALQGKQPTLLA